MPLGDKRIPSRLPTTRETRACVSWMAVLTDVSTQMYKLAHLLHACLCVRVTTRGTREGVIWMAALTNMSTQMHKLAKPTGYCTHRTRLRIRVDHVRIWYNRKGHTNKTRCTDAKQEARLRGGCAVCSDHDVMSGSSSWWWWDAVGGGGGRIRHATVHVAARVWLNVWESNELDKNKHLSAWHGTRRAAHIC